MIVKDAVNIAVDAKVEDVLLTHHSLRHTPEEVLDEARKVTTNLLQPPRLHVGLETVTLG